MRIFMLNKSNGVTIAYSNVIAQSDFRCLVILAALCRFSYKV